jgi:hypothetical protein
VAAGGTRVGRAASRVFSSGKKMFTAKTAYGRGKAFADTTLAAVDLGKALRETAKVALEANRWFEHASAGMAMVFAEQDLKNTLRDMSKGNQLSSSARDLAKPDDYYQRNTRDIDVLGRRIDNWLNTLSNLVVSSLLAPVNEIAEKIDKLIDQGKEKERPANFTDIVHDLGKQADAEKWDAQKRLDTVEKAAEEARRRNQGRR